LIQSATAFPAEFGLTEKKGLAALLAFVGLVSVHELLECRLKRSHYLIGVTPLQGSDHLLRHQFPGPEGVDIAR